MNFQFSIPGARVSCLRVHIAAEPHYYPDLPIIYLWLGEI